MNGKKKKKNWKSFFIFTFSQASFLPWLEQKITQLFYSAAAAAATAKSLQSCPTLCDPIDGSPPGSPVPGILQARTLEWVAISGSHAWKWKVKVKSLSHVRLLPCPTFTLITSYFTLNMRYQVPLLFIFQLLPNPLLSIIKYGSLGISTVKWQEGE